MHIFILAFLLLFIMFYFVLIQKSKIKKSKEMQFPQSFYTSSWNRRFHFFLTTSSKKKMVQVVTKIVQISQGTKTPFCPHSLSQITTSLDLILPYK
jgi:uncharacterized membrane protein